MKRSRFSDEQIIGILKEQESLIVSELSKFKIENQKIETDGEWISIQVITGK